MSAQCLSEEESQLLVSWLASIGMLTMYWTPVERHIDQCVHFLYEQQCSSDSAKKKPTRLNTKLDFVKEQISTEIIGAQEFENLVSLTRDTVKIRDVLAHGILNSYDQQKIVIGKVDGRRKEYVIKEFIIDIDRLNRSVNALSSLQKQWDYIAMELYKWSIND